MNYQISLILMTFTCDDIVLCSQSSLSVLRSFNLKYSYKTFKFDVYSLIVNNKSIMSVIGKNLNVGWCGKDIEILTTLR